MFTKISLTTLLLLIPLLAFGEGGFLYKKYCSVCHGGNKEGKTAPPLLPEFLKRITEKEFLEIVKNGIPATKMPAFSYLSDDQIKQIYAYVKKPVNVNWSKKSIEKSLKIINKKLNIKDYTDISNVTIVVERGENSIWILENDKLLGKFSFKNVHGGIKFSKTGDEIFVPARDGWIGKVNIKKGVFERKIRPCVYLRNIDISSDDKYVIASCWLPKNLVILDKKSFKPTKILSTDGKISAVYSLYKKNKAVYSFKDKEGVYILDLKSFKVTSIKTSSPITGFFIDPFDRYLIGSSKKEKKLKVYDLEKMSLVFENSISSMPHLFSVAVWYQNGKFFFATRHIKKPVITIWQMYSWKPIKQILLSGVGFFVRTHPDTPYLWTDISSDKVVLINKRNLKIKTVTVNPKKTFLHTEFSGDGKIAYLSVYDKNGSLVLINSKTLEKIKEYPASYPVGKYNYINKNRRFYPRLLGKQIYIQKCWGCHHTEKEAFAPSFKKIAATRDKNLIIAQILNPGGTYRLLGYKENYMPRFNFSQEELEAIVSFIKSLRENRYAKNN